MATPEWIVDAISTPGVIAAKLWLRGGSGSDPLGQRGAHQLLGSTLTRGCGPYDHLQVADLVEGCGAGLRCDTHEDGILISLKCQDSDARRLLPLLGWMLDDPHLAEEQVELEQDLSLQALQRQQEDPFHRAHDGWRQLAYGGGPYGHDPLGIAAELDTLDVETLRPLARQLARSQGILALSGTIPDGLLTEMQAFAGFSEPATDRDSSGANGLPIMGKTDRSERVGLQPLDTEQVVIMLGQPTLPHGHADDLALRMLQAHLGVGMTSVLFRRLREEHGVAYDVGIHHPARAGAAPFVLHASSSAERAELSLRLLQEAWDDLANRPLTAQEMALAAAKIRGQIAHATQTSGQRAERRAQLRALGLADDHDQTSLESLATLEPEQLRRAAERHLHRPLLSLCGRGAVIDSLATGWIQRVERNS
jgi:zinc protease